MTTYRNAAIAAGLTFALALGGAQLPARASEATSATTATQDGAASASEDVAPVDKANFYDGYVVTEDGADRLGGSSDDGASAQAITPLRLSDDMKYFAKWESSQNYRQGFGPGDGYNALGYYQFDRRYGLVDFMKACVEYNPERYAMFDAVIARASEVKDANVRMAYRDDSSGTPVRVYTELGRLVEDAWFAAYDNNSDEFSALQDAWAYQQYYVPATKWFTSKGMSLDGYSDSVKSLVWGATNLFGQTGVKWFLNGSGIHAGMSDGELVTALGDYIIDNVSARYPSQPQYWNGWRNRYKDERSHYLTVIRASAAAAPKTYSDVVDGQWYAPGVTAVTQRGLMSGYSGTTRFGVGDTMTRAQLAVVLYNYATNGGANAYYTSLSNTSGLSDVRGGQYWTAAANWAVSNKVINGVQRADGTRLFDPDGTVSFEMLVVVLANYAKATTGNTAALDGFTDGAEVSGWARPQMAWAVGKGLVSGKDNGDGTFTLAPGEPVARERAATVFMNAFDRGVLA